VHVGVSDRTRSTVIDASGTLSPACPHANRQFIGFPPSRLEQAGVESVHRKQTPLEVFGMFSEGFRRKMKMVLFVLLGFAALC